MCRCVTLNEPIEGNEAASCVGLFTDANLCCVIQMKQSDVTSRFKAFQVGEPQYNTKITIYPDYGSEEETETFSVETGAGPVEIRDSDLIFKNVAVTTVSTGSTLFSTDTNTS